MKKLTKLLVLIIISLSVIIVYKTENNNKVTYLTLGDSFSMGINSYGGVGYGYEDYFKDYLEKKGEVNFIDFYTSKNKDIKTIKNDILENNTYILDRNSLNIKKSLQVADIITISVGLNDIIYEYNIINNDNISEYEENKIVDYVYNNFLELLNNIRLYTKRKIYIIGYPENSNKYNSLIRKLNNKYKEIPIENIVFINTNNILSSEDFELKNSLYPNTNGYKKISKIIIEDYNFTQSK